MSSAAHVALVLQIRAEKERAEQLLRPVEVREREESFVSRE